MVLSYSLLIFVFPRLPPHDAHPKDYTPSINHNDPRTTSKCAYAQVVTLLDAPAMPSIPSEKIATNDFLDQLCSTEELPEDTWYFIAAVALSTLNKPGEIADILQFAIAGHKHDEQVRIASRIREALIKSAPVVGLPKVDLTFLVSFITN